MSIRRGFTLLEVLLAISLIVMLAASVGSFIFNLLDRRSTLLGVGRDVHAAAALIDRIEGDLLGAIAGDASAGAGIDGSSEQLRILTRGVWIDVAGQRNRATGGDLQRSEYRFEAESSRVLASRSPAGASTTSSVASKAEVVSDRVERVRFRYFDGREWLDSFDSFATQDLPVAVEVAVWMAAPGVAPRTPAGAFAPEESTIGGPASGEPTGDEARPSEFASDDAGWIEQQRWGEPDRLRVIVVPDGPVTSWREGS